MRTNGGAGNKGEYVMAKPDRSLSWIRADDAAVLNECLEVAADCLPACLSTCRRRDTTVDATASSTWRSTSSVGVRHVASVSERLSS